jgi:hypothetical protein
MPVWTFERGIAWVLAVMIGVLALAGTSQAQVSAIERLVMPGPLISGHAEAEAQCSNCHARFERERQRDLCVVCHENVAQDRAAGTGFHGLSPEVLAVDGRCVDCHTDHEGRDFDIVGLDEQAFDHGFTDFPLRDSHLEVECADCHTADEPHHTAATTCVGCHLEDDQHRGNLGEACADCHAETTWADTRFDHELTAGYALTGGHVGIPCVSCHVDEQYVDTPTECVGCHLEDDSHDGLNGTACESCHTTRDWQEVRFDHFDTTGFALLDAHGELACEDCHTGNKFEQELPTDCYGCHREDDAHDGTNGGECESCHQPTEWLDVKFDHAVDAGFALNGVHGDLLCTDCHTAPVDTYTPASDCFGCHEADDPHRAQLGSDCGGCHGEIEWVRDVRFDHDLTLFPLVGEHRERICLDCHETPAFQDAPEQCVDCHLEDDIHAQRLGPDCGDCHSPVDWVRVTFDHASETRFVLDGAHASLACEDCHQSAVNFVSELALPMSCGSCHRGDDIHDGEFGADCERCHSTRSFQDVKELR